MGKKAVAVRVTSDESTIVTPTTSLVSVPLGDIVVKRDALKRALARVTSVVDKSNSITILSHVAIRADRNGRVELFGTDLDVYLSVSLASSGTGGCSTTVAAHKLSAFVRTLTTDDVVIDPTAGPKHARIESGRVVARLESMSDRDFPKIPTHDDGAWTAVESATLRDAIDVVLPTTCKDQTRFHLNGAFMESDGATLTLTSTDGHRLTRVRRPWPGPQMVSGRIIPSKGLAQIRRTLSGTACEIAIGELYVFVRCGDETLAIKTIDATFPPCEQVIPTTHRPIVVDRAMLVEALSRAKLLCSDARGVTISFGAGAMVIASNDPDVGDVRETIPVAPDVRSCKVGARPSYMLDALEVIGGDQVTLAIGGELEPFVVRTAEDTYLRAIEHATALVVIMPMRI